MTNFTKALLEQCAIFSSVSSQSIEVTSEAFTRTTGLVADFVADIQQTCFLIEQEKDMAYLAFYTDRLVKQFDGLNNAVKKLQRKQQPQFRSSYRFHQNSHQLSKEERLKEYHKALRALDEKLSWLIEQNYQCQDAQQKQRYLFQIQETEYRKQKCLAAIQQIE